MIYPLASRLRTIYDTADRTQGRRVQVIHKTGIPTPHRPVQIATANEAGSADGGTYLCTICVDRPRRRSATTVPRPKRSPPGSPGPCWQPAPASYLSQRTTTTPPPHRRRRRSTATSPDRRDRVSDPASITVDLTGTDVTAE